MGQAWSPDRDQWRQAPSSKPPDTRIRPQAWAAKWQAASIKLDKGLDLGYSGIMELSDFLDKHHSRADKMRILKKMLKVAEANKTKTVSIKKARSIIFNHREGDMKI